ncbi:heavy metal sensor histidine kinase [Prosthecobacter sp.]|uniref:HAMP domain-containing sensor histidine kinase n=1 Tax=Prosthecobacter sp. TaxID=1965333 RepID=UPI002ABBD3C1|nr:heavy metal sensor histidine kinase [Prosthecobacter sp.]MDZ4402779.1 heavy metal sensor histidine kinase [Prosthecobacter sp.]
MKSLRARLFISFTALLAAALMMFGVIVWLVAREAMTNDMDDFLRGKAMLLSRLMPAERLRVEPWMEQDLQVQERQFGVQVFDVNGTPGGKSSTLAIEVPLTDKVRRSEHPAGGVILETLVIGGKNYRVATHPRRDRWGEPVVMYAQAVISFDALQARQARLLAWLVSCGTAMLAAGAAASWYLSRQWLRSVSSLEEAARGLSSSELGLRRLFAPSDDAELAALANSFNHLLDRLEAAYKTQQRFTADASHELRTPLTVLRGEIEVALRRPRSAEEYREVLVSNKEEIERLSRLTENMLALAHVDVGDAITQRELVNVSELCAGVTARLQNLATERQITLHHEDTTDEPLSVNGDRIALERVMTNLVENAVRYSPGGESVTVRICKSPPCIEIQVIDTGGGIAPEHLPHLFERFYRVDKARSRANGGSGLGLSIVKALVEAHGGGVSVMSEVGHGSTFTVRLPAA